MIAGFNQVAATIGFRVLYICIRRCSDAQPSPAPSIPSDKSRNEKKLIGLIHVFRGNLAKGGYILENLDVQRTVPSRRGEVNKFEMRVTVK